MQAGEEEGEEPGGEQPDVMPFLAGECVLRLLQFSDVQAGEEEGEEPGDEQPDSMPFMASEHVRFF